MLGKPIPLKMRVEMDADPMMHVCMRYELLGDHECEADPITGKLLDWEHVFTFGGSKINQKWAIISICYLVHRGGKLNKEINRWISLNRAKDDELRRVSKAIPYLNMRERLNKLYGKETL